MKKLLLSTTALLGFTAGAMAADLPRRMAPPVFAPVPVFSWTGFYVGVNAGYGWGDDNSNNFLGFGATGLTVPTGFGATAPVVPAVGTAFPAGFAGNNGNDSGFVGGAQVGFNWQLNPGSGFVVGVEADIQWADLGGGGNGGFGGGFGTAVPVASIAPGLGIGAPVIPNGNVAFFGNGAGNRGGGSDWFATARVRVGYAFDRVLVYATGGLAFTDDSGNRNIGVFNGGQIPAAFYTSAASAIAGSTVFGGLVGNRNNSNDMGWTLGGGVEWAFTNNLTFKLEGLWVSMDNNNNNGAFNNIVGVSNTGAPISGANAGFFGGGNNNGDFFIARVGVNYKFGS